MGLENRRIQLIDDLKKRKRFGKKTRKPYKSTYRAKFKCQVKVPEEHFLIHNRNFMILGEFFVII